MSEEENVQSTKPDVQEPQGTPEQEPPKIQSTELIDKANAAAERLERATERLAKENERRERIAVERALGGTGTTNNAKQEESATEYAHRALRGEFNVNGEEDESEKER